MKIEHYIDQLAAKVAHRIEAIAVEKTVPVRTGELRQSIHVSRMGHAHYAVGTNKIYARAVHDGRPAIIIRPRRKKALYWKGARHPVKKVHQPPRRPNPFLRKAADLFLKNVDEELHRLAPELPDVVVKEIAKGLKVKRK